MVHFSPLLLLGRLLGNQPVNLEDLKCVLRILEAETPQFALSYNHWNTWPLPLFHPPSSNIVIMVKFKLYSSSAVSIKAVQYHTSDSACYTTKPKVTAGILQNTI